MYDTSPLSPLKGETRQPWPGGIKELESLFDLDPALEESLDFSELETNNDPTGLGFPDSSVVTNPTSTAEGPLDLLTLTVAATTEHLAQLESQAPIFTTGHGVAVGATSASLPLSQPSPSHAQVVLPVSSLSVDNVLMPEYQSLVAMSTPSTITTSATSQVSVGDQWEQQTPFCSTVKTEDLSLSSLPACSLEASLPGFTSTTCKTEPLLEDDSSQFSDILVSPRSTRSMSESSTATSVVPDSPRPRTSKGGSKRRQIPKGSEEYKEKRARNNVAVRKSRAKAKEKQRMTESRVKELLDMNESLRKRLEMLTKEVTVLKGLFINVGASLPEEFSKLMETS